MIAAMLAGVLSGFVTAILQTKLGVDSLLAGIIVNTALYSVNIAVMGGSSLINMNRTVTVFSMMKEALSSTPLKGREDIIVALIAVILVVAFLVFFLKTRLGLAIRATGNNSDMVKSSSINPVFTTIIGLCVANAFTALSGCLLSQSQKSVDINIGQGMVTIALASLLIRWYAPRPWRDLCESRGNGSWFLYFPPCIHHRTSIQYAGIYAEAGILCHRCSCNLRTIS